LSTFFKRPLWMPILAVLTVGWLLAACSSASPATEAPAQYLPAIESQAETTPTAVTAKSTQQAQFLPALENQANANPTETQTPAEVTPPAARKTIKAGLEASDPGTAQLASGEIQLVEFFAFW
jgi:hypothetical protein